MFKIEFDTDNAAFYDTDGGFSPFAVADILRNIAREVERDYVEGKVRDINGNPVGAWDLRYDDRSHKMKEVWGVFENCGCTNEKLISTWDNYDDADTAMLELYTFEERGELEVNIMVDRGDGNGYTCEY